MRRTISIIAAGLLLVAVIATVVLATGHSSTNSKPALKTVRGVIGSEKLPFFQDPAVVAEFAKQGYAVQVDTAGSRQIATTVDLTKYDFAFPAGTPAALQIESKQHLTKDYVPFFTPMAIATFTPIAQLLQSAGVATDQNGYWTLDVKKYLDLVAKNQRWTDLPNNTTYPVPKQILVTTTDISTSNSAAMYASIVSYVANGNSVLATPAAAAAAVPALAPLFLEQGYTESSSAGPFQDYLTIGEGKTPMVMIYESQFVAAAVTAPSSIQSSMVLMYPDPTTLSKHTVVPLTPAGDQVGQLLTNDPVLQGLAVKYGFRTTDTAAFTAEVAKVGVKVPAQLLNIVDTPTYDTLDALINGIIATSQSTGTTSTTSTTPTSG